MKEEGSQRCNCIGSVCYEDRSWKQKRRLCNGPFADPSEIEHALKGIQTFASHILHELPQVFREDRSGSRDRVAQLLRGQWSESPVTYGNA
jgi:hypothetical protein